MLKKQCADNHWLKIL